MPNSSSAETSSTGTSTSAISSISYAPAHFTVGASPESPHVPLSDQASVPVVRGPQGGFHIFLSTGWDTQPAPDQHLHYVLRRGGTVVADGLTYVTPQAVGPAFETYGSFMFLNFDVDASGWLAEPIHAQVTLETTDPQQQTERTWLATCCQSGGFGNGDDAGERDGESPDGGG